MSAKPSLIHDERVEAGALALFLLEFPDSDDKDFDALPPWSKVNLKEQSAAVLDATERKRFPLTPTQQDFLRVLQRYIDLHGFAPTVDELRAITTRKSKSNIVWLLRALEDRGWIERAPKLQRAITIIHRLETSV